MQFLVQYVRGKNRPDFTTMFNLSPDTQRLSQHVDIIVIC